MSQLGAQTNINLSPGRWAVNRSAGTGRGVVRSPKGKLGIITERSLCWMLAKECGGGEVRRGYVLLTLLHLLTLIFISSIPSFCVYRNAGYSNRWYLAGQTKKIIRQKQQWRRTKKKFCSSVGFLTNWSLIFFLKIEKNNVFLSGEGKSENHDCTDLRIMQAQLWHGDKTLISNLSI